MVWQLCSCLIRLALACMLQLELCNIGNTVLPVLNLRVTSLKAKRGITSSKAVKLSLECI